LTKKGKQVAVRSHTRNLKGAAKSWQKSQAASYEYVVQGRYASQYGWEDLTSEANRKDALQRLREYNQEEPYPHRMIRRRL
jgi:hypothetical protein